MLRRRGVVRGLDAPRVGDGAGSRVVCATEAGMTPEENASRADESAEPGPEAEERIRVRLALGAKGLAFEGRRAFFEAHVARYLEALYRESEHGIRAGEPAAAPAGATFQPSAPQRFQQFAGQVGANAATIEQRTMAFAFYLWNYERRDAFDAEAIAAFFRTTHEEPPEDLAVLLAELATTRRWLEPADEADHWRLTTKGVNYVKNRLLGDL